MIINQGTAGGYGTLPVGRIVIGRALYNGNARYMGSDGLRFMDLAQIEENAVAQMDFPQVPPLLETDRTVRKALESLLTLEHISYDAGIIASSDQWNEAPHHIRDIQKNTGALCEEMEAAAVLMTACRFDVPCGFIKVISNNNEEGIPFDMAVGSILPPLLKKFCSLCF